MPKLNQQGDTIVEVLISLSVLALAFAISYSTAKSTLINVQNSQEHSVALEQIDSQAEELRYMSSQPLSSVGHSGNAFCFYTGTGSSSNQILQKLFTTAAPGDIKNNYPPECQMTQGGFSYYIAIIPTTANTYNISVWWPGLGSLGNQTEHISYRVYQD